MAVHGGATTVFVDLDAASDDTWDWGRCNAFCQDDLHCEVAYAIRTLTNEEVLHYACNYFALAVPPAEVVDVRDAPEAPYPPPYRRLGGWPEKPLVGHRIYWRVIDGGRSETSSSA